MWLWNEWFNPNSFYSYCAVVPFISGLLIYQRIKESGFAWEGLLFPIGFLVFMFPLPDDVTAQISFNLKFLCAQISSLILNIIHVNARAQGNVIILDHGAVVVNDACSGIRALISLFAMGTVLAYWMKAGISQKIILVLSTLPIAILVNALRIAFLAVITEFWGAQYTNGIIHNLAGFLLFGFGFSFLMAIKHLLRCPVSHT